MVEIETERLLLRGWRNEDLEPHARICADPEVMRFIGDGTTLTRKQSEEQIARFVRLWEEQDFVGFVGLVYQEEWTEGRHKTEVGWRLGRGFWGRGFATEAAEASVAYGVGSLGLERIISIIQPANAASRRVAEKTGLTLRGEARWRDADVVWYAIDRDDQLDP